jgi:hypothetical protein
VTDDCKSDSTEVRTEDGTVFALAMTRIDRPGQKEAMDVISSRGLASST